MTPHITWDWSRRCLARWSAGCPSERCVIRRPRLDLEIFGPRAEFGLSEPSKARSQRCFAVPRLRELGNRVRDALRHLLGCEIKRLDAGQAFDNRGRTVASGMAEEHR